MITDFSHLHSNYDRRCRAVVDKTFDRYYSLQLITRGEVRLRYDQNEYNIKPGTFWSAFPGPHIQFHSTSSKSWEHRYIAFTGGIVHRWITLGLFPYCPVYIPDWQDWVERFDRIIEYAQSNDRLKLIASANQLEALLIHLAGRQNQEQEPEWLALLFNHIAACNYQNIDYPDLARRCGLALSTLRKKFRNHMHESLHAYVIRKRIERACQLLADPHRNLDSIADELDYKDVYFFSRQFKNVQGITPGQFRHSLQ